MSFELAMFLLSLIERGPKALQDVAVSLRQRGEWTPEQDAKFDADSARIFARDHWKRKD